jgi:hypothetical protein
LSLNTVLALKCMAKPKKPRKDSVRNARRDTTDTYGVRGAGATWQASFGMALSEADLLFAVWRERVANRIVFQVAHDVFDNWFRVEEISDKPDPNFDREVQKVLADLNAKAVFTEMAAYKRLFGWAIIAMTIVDYEKDPAQPVKNPKEIRELIAYSSLQFSVQSSDEDKKPLPVTAETLGRSLEAVRVKIRRLGLVVVDRKKKNSCSTTTTAKVVLPNELFSVEEVIKEIHAAVAGLKTPGLNKTEVMRLRLIEILRRLWRLICRSLRVKWAGRLLSLLRTETSLRILRLACMCTSVLAKRSPLTIMRISLLQSAVSSRK